MLITRVGNDGLRKKAFLSESVCSTPSKLLPDLPDDLEGVFAHAPFLPSLAPRPRSGAWTAPWRDTKRPAITGLPGQIGAITGMPRSRQTVHGVIPLRAAISESSFRDSSRAQTATGAGGRSHTHLLRDPQNSQGGKRVLHFLPGKPEKNPGVWQRWQVNVPSNAMQRDKVLERDLERQRGAYGLGDRLFASPARSHAASLFFAAVPGGAEGIDYFPAGAMRRVARPQTRQMLSPKMATGSSVSSTSSPAKKSQSAEESLPSASIEDLQNEDLVFERDEAVELTEVLDAYARLTAGVDQASILSSTSAPNLTSPQMSIGRGETGGLQGSRKMEHKAIDDPFMLRSVFCRFLLASKICGAAGSLHHYHKTLADFDKYAMTMGAYTGLPRSLMILVIARMLRLKGDDGLEDRVSMGTVQPPRMTWDAVEGKYIEQEPRPLYIKLFFQESIGFASEHCSFRKLRSETREQDMSSVESGDVLGNVLSDVSAGSVWPPLPPKSAQGQLPEYMSGVRRWQEELEAQNPARILAIRRYTETVLRGEILNSQLLEPEVLHFASRFRPLFEHMFSAYADWPSPAALQDAAEEEDNMEANFSQPILEMHKLGHLSFTSFFRFCIDFGLFPKHASFEEIRQIYSDAEAVVELPRASPPSTAGSDRGTASSLGETEVERGRSKKPGSAGPKRQVSASAKAAGKQVEGKKERVPGGKSSKSAKIEVQGPSALEDPLAVAVKKGPRKSIIKVDDIPTDVPKIPAHLLKNKKSQQAAAIAESAAKAAAEAAVPKADLQFMEDSFMSLTDLELRTITFFASIDDWLSERSMRFSDIWNDVGAEGPEAWTSRPRPDPANAFQGGGSDALSFTRDGDAPAASEVEADLPDSVLQLQKMLMRQAEDTAADGQRRSSEADGKAMQAAAAAAAAAASAARAVPPVPIVNAATLLELIFPMGMANKPTEEEVNDMYGRVLSGANLGKGPLGIAVFQMDKILRAAKRGRDKGRQSCCALLRVDCELKKDGEKEVSVVRFFDALNTALLDRSGFLGVEEDFLRNLGDKFPVSKLFKQAEEMGLDISDPEKGYPEREKFGMMVVDHIAPGGKDMMLRPHHVYSALALVQEGRRSQRRIELQSSLSCLAASPVGAPATGERKMPHYSGPTTTLFGLAAFVECLLKLALHRLGGKGSNEIQRGSPAWWKCAWLIALLSGEFNKHVKRHKHEHMISEFAREAKAKVSEKLSRVPEASSGMSLSSGMTPLQPGRTSKENHTEAASKPRLSSKAAKFASNEEPGGSAVKEHKPPRSPSRRRHTMCEQGLAEEMALATRQHMGEEMGLATRQSSKEQKARQLDLWHHRTYSAQLPRYMPPLEHLLRDRPDLFDPETGEATSPKADASGWPVLCPQCNETPSPSGWGTPGCSNCSGVEELCLPISKHLFSSLLRTPQLDRFGLIKEGDDGEEEAGTEVREGSQWSQCNSRQPSKRMQSKN